MRPFLPFSVSPVQHFKMYTAIKLRECSLSRLSVRLPKKTTKKKLTIKQDRSKATSLNADEQRFNVFLAQSHTHIQTHTCGGFIRDLYCPKPVTKQVESARKLFPCFLPVDVIVPALYWVVLP